MSKKNKVLEDNQMSMIQDAKNDFDVIKNEYKALNSNVKFIDKVSFALLLVFTVNFFLISLNSAIIRSAANVFMMILPLFMAAIVFSFRGKAKEDNLENFKKDFGFMMAVLFVMSLLATFVHWS